MTDPDSHDDDWSELNRELGVENASTPTDEPGPPPDDVYSLAGAAPLSDEDADAPAELGEGEESDEMEVEGGGEVASGGEGQPGTGRKRRRRRRRRKKGGAVGADADAGGPPAEADAGGEDDGSTDTYSGRRSDDEGEADEDGAVEIEPDAAPLAAEEDTGGELLRDLIATWNVPSWDEIVGGLYRPDR
jgi:ribonuclease E